MEAILHRSLSRRPPDGELHFVAAQASPSDCLPVAKARVTFHVARSISATWFELTQETYATFPSGRTSTSSGSTGVVTERATFIVSRSITATSFTPGKAISSQWPSTVGALPYPRPSSGTQVLTWLAAVSITAIRGLVWSAVKTHLSSIEIEMRCVMPEMGMTLSVLRAAISSTDTVPGPTLAGADIGRVAE